MIALIVCCIVFILSLMILILVLYNGNEHGDVAINKKYYMGIASDYIEITKEQYNLLERLII